MRGAPGNAIDIHRVEAGERRIKIEVCCLSNFSSMPSVASIVMDSCKTFIGINQRLTTPALGLRGTFASIRARLMEGWVTLAAIVVAFGLAMVGMVSLLGPLPW